MWVSVVTALHPGEPPDVKTPSVSFSKPSRTGWAQRPIVGVDVKVCVYVGVLVFVFRLVV